MKQKDLAILSEKWNKLPDNTRYYIIMETLLNSGITLSDPDWSDGGDWTSINIEEFPSFQVKGLRPIQGFRDGVLEFDNFTHSPLEAIYDWMVGGQKRELIESLSRVLSSKTTVGKRALVKLMNSLPSRKRDIAVVKKEQRQYIIPRGSI